MTKAKTDDKLVARTRIDVEKENTQNTKLPTQQISRNKNVNFSRTFPIVCNINGTFVHSIFRPVFI